MVILNAPILEAVFWLQRPRVVIVLRKLRTEAIKKRKTNDLTISHLLMPLLDTASGRASYRLRCGV